jgi:hypothetical protein
MKFTLIPFLLFLYASVSFSQTLEDNLNRYWYYRDRLEQHYMIVGSPQMPGTNWPAERIFFAGRNMLGSGENPTHPFSEYLCVLATEYRLLKNYREHNLADETLQKTAWALESFDRVDLNTEKFFRARMDGVADNDPDFWNKVNQYIKPGDLNGFFLRGDVDGQCSIKGWNNRSETSYPVNPDANLLNYNNGQLKEPFPGVFVESVSCRLNDNGVVNSKNRSVMSQDEVWGLLLGLAFINTLVDDKKQFKDLEGNNVTLRQWARNITYRVVRALSYDDKAGRRRWHLKNPVNGELIEGRDGGGTIALSWLFAKAGNAICGGDFPNLQTYESAQMYLLDEKLIQPISMLENLTTNYISVFIPYVGLKIKVTSLGISNLAMIAGEKNLAYYMLMYKKSSEYFKISSNERLPAIYSILNGIPIKEALDSSDYNAYKKDYFHILSQAVDCGPWIKRINGKQSEVSDPWWHVNRNGDLNRIYIRPEVYKNYDSRYQDGMDYMFLHNLYWLLFMTPPQTDDSKVENDSVHIHFTYKHYRPDCKPVFELTNK